MFDLILITYLSYRNGVRAKRNGKNAVAWGLATVGAYLLCMMIGLYLVIFVFCRNDINLDQMSSLDKSTRDAAMAHLVDVFTQNPVRYITVEAFGFGGYLLIRYILDRNANKKGPEVHWMDKMGEQ